MCLEMLTNANFLFLLFSFALIIMYRLPIVLMNAASEQRDETEWSEIATDFR